MSDKYTLGFSPTDPFQTPEGMFRIQREKIPAIPVLIFLDVDGVLNGDSLTGVKVRFDMFGANNDYAGIYKSKVEILNRLHNHHPGAKYVMSSTWRECYPETMKYLKRQGFSGKFIGHTAWGLMGERFGQKATRGEEITDWLYRSQYAGRVVVIDDDPTIQEITNKDANGNPFFQELTLIQTNPYTGLMESDLTGLIKP